MQQHTPEHFGLQLRPEDAAALDALIDSRVLGPRLADARPAPDVDPEARRRVERVARLLDRCPVEDAPADLVKRTMHRVIAATSIDLDIARVHASHRGPGLPLRLSEIVAVAAMVLIGVSLALPVLNRNRAESMRIACESNLSAAGRAFGLYAADYLGTMPRGRIVPNSPWYRIGYTINDRLPVRSNSANLYRLVRLRYIDPSSLACPENAAVPGGMTVDMYDWPNPEAVSYSYQNQFSPSSIRLDRDPQLAILADKNPKFVVQMTHGGKLYYLSAVPDITASNTHRLRGQNVLYADGSVWWSLHPLTPNGDNIWLARGVEDYNGTETPTDANDTFLVP